MHACGVSLVWGHWSDPAHGQGDSRVWGERVARAKGPCAGPLEPIQATDARRVALNGLSDGGELLVAREKPCGACSGQVSRWCAGLRVPSAVWRAGIPVRSSYRVVWAHPDENDFKVSNYEYSCKFFFLFFVFLQSVQT